MALPIGLPCLKGNRAAVDWPTAGHWGDLAAYYPDAKIVLTSRSAESWFKSISETILKAIHDPEDVPEIARPVTRMALRVVVQSIGEDWSREALIARFHALEAAVKKHLPADRLLVFSPSQGWGPLCKFLNKPVPDTPFPRSNARDEFFANIASFE
jgi:hypothetical protein